MHGHRHVGRDIGNRRVDQIAVDRAERFRIVAAVLHLLAIFRIAQHGDEDLVELQIAAAGIGKGAHRFLVGLAEIGEELIERRIDRLVDRRGTRAAVQRRRRRNGHFRRARGVRFEEFEMLDHRMAGEADLAGDLDALVARRHRGKGDAGIHDMALDAVEPPQEVEMPPRAAEFAVGDRLQPGRFLFLDDVLDGAVLDRLERGGVDLAFGALLARLFQRGRPQQAADMIGAERRLGSLHYVFLPLFSSPVYGGGRERSDAGGGQCSMLAQASRPDPHPTLPLSGRGICLIPTLRRPTRRSCAALPIPRLRPAHCLLRSRRSRIAATGKADRAR